jgi:hypothetical protein
MNKNLKAGLITVGVMFAVVSLLVFIIANDKNILTHIFNLVAVTGIISILYIVYKLFKQLK